MRVASLLALITATACGGGGSGGTASAPPTALPVASSCGVEAQKDFVLDVANSWYLWYDEMARVNRDDFASADDLLRALTAPLAEDFRDPGFSYLTSIAEDEAFTANGTYVGFGFRYDIDPRGRYLLSDVFESGPAFAAGLRRGDELLAVDSGEGYVSVREFEARGISIAEVFGEAIVGLQRGFRLINGGGEFEVSVEKRNLDIPPVAAAPRRLERAGLAPAAYIHLRGFIRSANVELERAFGDIAGEGITDFVIDLRYNSGGQISVAERFLDLLGGEIAAGRIGYQLVHNDKQATENFSYAMRRRGSSAAPLRIAFITSAETASSSELLINGLAPFVEVALIGSDTLGKAVGQYAFDLEDCDTRLLMVSFEIRNGDGFGDYYTGLVDTGRFTLCAAEDQFSGPFGTTDDALTASALGWLNEGVCPTDVEGAAARGRALPRSPEQAPPAVLTDRKSARIQ